MSFGIICVPLGSVADCRQHVILPFCILCNHSILLETSPFWPSILPFYNQAEEGDILYSRRYVPDKRFFPFSCNNSFRFLFIHFKIFTVYIVFCSLYIFLLGLQFTPQLNVITTVELTTVEIPNSCTVSVKHLQLRKVIDFTPLLSINIIHKKDFACRFFVQLL